MRREARDREEKKEIWNYEAEMFLKIEDNRKESALEIEEDTKKQGKRRRRRRRKKEGTKE